MFDETRTERGPAYAAAQFLFLDTLSTMTLYVDEGRDRSIHADQPSDLLEPDTAFYLAAWESDNPEVVRERLDRISTTADKIIETLEK